MKQLFLLTISCCMALQGYTQNLTLTFTPANAALTISNVSVHNNKTGTTTNVSGNIVLLNDITLGITTSNAVSKNIRVFPNPYTNEANIHFSSGSATSATINLIDMVGKVVATMQQNIEQGEYNFSLAGGIQGMYQLQVIANGAMYSLPIVCNNTTASDFKIHYSGKKATADQQKLKSAVANTPVSYTPGDGLTFKCVSGDYSTIIADIPNKDFNYSVGLYACTDASGNNYTTITLGTQVWMAENLKTTKYADGTLIGTTTPDTLDISGEATPKYQWACYKKGGLSPTSPPRVYTWNAAMDARNVCPTGWHLSNKAEWETLKNYLIDNGYEYEGNGQYIAKSMATTTGWTQNATIGTIGNDPTINNKSGFSANPVGQRNLGGTFSDYNEYTGWWDTGSGASGTAGNWYLLNDKGYSQFRLNSRKIGQSVRCVKD